MKHWARFSCFWLLSTTLALSLFGAAGADEINLKQKKSSGNDAALANMYSVRKDYFLRFPHAKMAEMIRASGRIPDSSKEQSGSTYTLPSSDLSLKIPPGPLLMKQSGPPKSPDPYILKRPQYRPLFAYCGGVPGAFLPQVQPGMLGNYLPNYSRSAAGQGAAVITAVPQYATAYVQPLLQVDNAQRQAQEGDQSEFEYELTTFGVGPISDTQFQMIDREDNQRFLELLFDPERWLWTARAAGIMQQQQMSTNLANTADWESNAAMETICESLINVADEDAAVSVHGSPSHKSKAQAVYMVQQMYRQVFLPMAVLLLLPGAVLTQMKGMAQFGLLNSNDDDSQSPFSGIVRSLIAIFLIPATQLIVSYMVDVGNCLSYQVKQWIDLDTLTGYAHEQQYGPQRDMTYNCLTERLPPPREKSSTDQSTDIAAARDAGGGEDEHLGKAYSKPESKAIEEKSPQLSKQMQMLYNLFNCAASLGLVVLCDFQMVMMCYLFLLGPVAAAFYAWPNMAGRGGGSGLFNKVFSNWIEAVVVLSLWRFWWSVVLACLSTYIQWSRDLAFFDPHSEWELMIFTSFQVLMLAVPFQPFKFDAAPHIEQIEKMSADNSKKGEGAAGGGSGGGSSSSGSSGAPGRDGSHAAGPGGNSASGGSAEKTGESSSASAPSSLIQDASKPAASPTSSSSASADPGKSNSAASDSGRLKSPPVITAPPPPSRF
ncbi:MAG: hypothetical protein K2X27_18655 [Candidatus Obscuribacterales bacterium]|nr:hypothetical protein [Candidatus Obscuribacterales bacterium]